MKSNQLGHGNGNGDAAATAKPQKNQAPSGRGGNDGAAKPRRTRAPRATTTTAEAAFAAHEREREAAGAAIRALLDPIIAEERAARLVRDAEDAARRTAGVQWLDLAARGHLEPDDEPDAVAATEPTAADRRAARVARRARGRADLAADALPRDPGTCTVARYVAASRREALGFRVEYADDGPTPGVGRTFRRYIFGGVALHLATLADAFAASFARKWEAYGGRPIPADLQEECAAIYRFHFARCFAGQRPTWHKAAKGQPRRAEWITGGGAGIVPGSKFGLYASRRNCLTFRQLRAWLATVRAAGAAVRAAVYGKGAELVSVVSLDAPLFGDACRPATLADVRDLADRAARGGLSALDLADDDAPHRLDRAAVRVTPALRLAVRRYWAHGADCLRVFWGLSGSQRAAASLAADLRTLGQAARVTLRGGTRGLDASLIGDSETAANDGLRQRVHRIRERIASGDVLLTEQPDSAESILRIHALRPGARAVRTPGLDLAPAPIPAAESPAAVLAWARHNAGRTVRAALARPAADPAARVRVICHDLPAAPAPARALRLRAVAPGSL